MPPQLHAVLEVLPGWERFEFAGSLGGVRHLASDKGLHPNVIVTLDKWAGAVDAERAISVVSEQLRGAGATIRSTTDLSEDERAIVEIQTDEPGDDAGPVRVRYRLTLLPVAGDTLVLTGIATCRLTQDAVLANDFSRILASVELQAHGNNPSEHV